MQVITFRPTKPSAMARAYNLRADGAAVTTHAVRKWLLGVALPTHEKLTILARWLNVHASWLLFGDAEKGDYVLPSTGEEALSTEQLMLVRDVFSLPQSSQVVVRDQVDSLMRSVESSHNDFLRSTSQRGKRNG